MTPSSVTKHCEFGERQLEDRRKLLIIDTPGFFDTETEKEKLVQEISCCVSLSSPGPHAFLFVISPGRFTEEEVNTVEEFFKMFGSQVERYMIVVFTSADQLEGSIDEFIEGSSKLKDLVQRCSNRKYAIDNKTKSKRDEQVRELVKNIDAMVKENGNKFYTNDMYEENAKLLAEQEQQLKLENERKEREKVEAIEANVTMKFEGQLNEMKQNDILLTNRLESTQKQMKEMEASLGKLFEIKLKSNIQNQFYNLFSIYHRFSQTITFLSIRAHPKLRLQQYMNLRRHF